MSGATEKVDAGGSATETRRDLRAAILRASSELFAEHGFAKTSLREVAAACGCTKPALYYYFANKDELYQEVISKLIGEMEGMLRATLEAEGGIRERIHHACHGFFDYVSANPSVIKLLWRIDLEMRSQPADVVRQFMGAREMHMHVMTEIFRQGMASGELRDDIEPEDCAVALAGTIDFHLQLKLQGETRPIERINATLDLLFDGISRR